MRKTEYQKMLNGDLYNAGDKELIEMRRHARTVMHAYNQTVFDKMQREILLQKLLRKMGNNVDIQTPFLLRLRCSYRSRR
jgi:maltose O-acetyltransferase